MSPSNSTRWCPTPEQLMILEEMYRGGIRTPKASQIQKITAHLSFYGKIEGKNVFYWFQNHKARERQKLRRKLSKQLYQQQLLQEQLYLHQHQNNQENNFLRSNGSSSSTLHHQVSIDKSVDYLRQGGVDGASAQMTNSTWKEDPPNMYEMQNTSMMRSCGDDWMMMLMMMRDAGPTLNPYCCSSNRQLKTLELFPITTPNVKDHQGTISEPSPISSSTSPNLNL